MKKRIEKISIRAKKLIAEGNTESAMQMILADLPVGRRYDKIKDHIVILSNQFKDLERNRNLGLKFDETKINHINLELINILSELDHLEETGISKVESEVSRLRVMLFLAKDSEVIERILFEAKKIALKYPDEYSAIKFVVEAERSLLGQRNIIERLDKDIMDGCVNEPAGDLILKKRMLPITLIVIVILIILGLIGYFLWKFKNT